MIRAIVADDEPLARSKIRGLLDLEQDFEIVAECGDGASALRKLRVLEPDVLFLDIQMPGISGIELLHTASLRSPPYTVIISAHDQYVVQAFEVNANDYLLKPFDGERFAVAIDRIRRQVQLEARARNYADINQLMTTVERRLTKLEKPQSSARIPVKIGTRTRFLSTQAIKYVKADKDYVNIKMVTGEVIHTNDRISHMEHKLPTDQFARIHRSAIINLDQIKEIRSKGYCYEIVLSEGETFDSGVTFKRKIQSLQAHWKR